MLNKKEVESFLVNKRGYLKKSPLETLKAIWKQSSKHTLPKNKAELEKELILVKNIQSDLRTANVFTENTEKTLLEEVYHAIIEEKNRPIKRLFFDIETSPNIVFSWRVGNKINLTPDNIIEERAIICISYKWEGEDKVYSLKWDNGDDKDMLAKFAKIMDSADVVIGQNSDRFDIKWVRARCIYHQIPLSAKFNSLDTLKMAKAGFNFNSNKLDYMGQYLGVGQKIHTGYDLWKRICLHNDKEALQDMITYCEQDVRLLEEVYNKLQDYVPVKKFKFRF
jgi:DNA polymerase elongation subunit (family B)